MGVEGLSSVDEERSMTSDRARRRGVSWRLRVLCVALFSMVMWVGAAPARAQQALAESLFQEARALLEQGKVAEACPKFAESHRLDPATGTLLGLAMCHEQQGKFASAWAEFVEVQGMAKREGQQKRVDFAKSKADALRLKLSTLTISVGSDVGAIEGLEIKRNGVLVGKGAWNVAAPVDGGEHQIEARAPGRIPWGKTVTVANSEAVEAVAVPLLELAPVEEGAAVAEPAASAEASSTRERRAPPKSTPDEGLDTQQWVGIGVAGGGLISLGVGGLFLMDALSKKADADEECQGNVCNADGVRLRNDAVDQGDLATIFSLTGAALMGAGATIYLLSDGPQERGAQHSSRLFIGAGRGGVNATLSGTF